MGYLLGGAGYRGYTYNIVIAMEYNRTTNVVKWRKHEIIKTISSYMAAVTDGELIYFMGGLSNQKGNRFPYDTVAYNPVMKKTKPLAPLPFGVAASTAVFYEGFIYLPAGKYGGHGYSIIRYNIEEDFWEELNVTLKYEVTGHVCALVVSGEVQPSFG